jgi:hypothetical protein
VVASDDVGQFVFTSDGRIEGVFNYNEENFGSYYPAVFIKPTYYSEYVG